jgi:hypothetical protein
MAPVLDPTCSPGQQSEWANYANPVSRDLGVSAERPPVRIADYSSKWKVLNWESVDTAAFSGLIAIVALAHRPPI